MNHNPKITFKFPSNEVISCIVITVLLFVISHTLFMVLLVILELLSDITWVNFFLSFLFALLIFILPWYSTVIDRTTISYFKYKKVFSEHPISSVNNFVEVTNGKYGYHDDVLSQLSELISKKYITGCKLGVINRNEWVLICTRTGEPLLPQQPVVDKETTTTESDELITELTNLSELLNTSENSGSTTVTELAILSKLLESGALTEDEFKQVKNDLLNRK